MKMKKIAIAVTIASASMFAGSAFADDDKVGDSMVNLPKDGSIVDSKSVDVWFVEIEGATGYSVDLVGVGKDDVVATHGCNNAAPEKRIYEKSMFLSSTGLDCGQETSETKPGDGDTADLHLCKWTTPDLADGNYAIAINPVAIGAVVATGPEQRDATNCAGNDTTAHTNNTLVAIVAATLTDDANYNNFKVRASTTVVTAKPNIPEPLLPAAGSTLTGVEQLTFIDTSTTTQEATWYELWVYDKNNTRVMDIDDNPTFTHWYKNTVDDELTCTTTNAAGHRLCKIDIKTGGANSTTAAGSTIKDADAADIFTWWVKGYNSMGPTGWSSSPGTFKK